MNAPANICDLIAQPPITAELVDQLQDISSTLAACAAPEPEILAAYAAPELRPYQVFTIAMARRSFALAQTKIIDCTAAELDQLVTVYAANGWLTTVYRFGATIYSRPDGSIIAMSVGDRHYCPREIRPIRTVPLSMYKQFVGRIRRPGSKSMTADLVPVSDKPLRPELWIASVDEARQMEWPPALKVNPFLTKAWALTPVVGNTDIFMQGFDLDATNQHQPTSDKPNE